MHEEGNKCQTAPTEVADMAAQPCARVRVIRVCNVTNPESLVINHSPRFPSQPDPRICKPVLSASPPPSLNSSLLSTSVYNSDHPSVASSARSFIRRPRVSVDPGRVSSAPETNGSTWCSGVSLAPTPWSCSTTPFSRCRWQMLPSSCSGEVSLDPNHAQPVICLTLNLSTALLWTTWFLSFLGSSVIRFSPPCWPGSS